VVVGSTTLTLGKILNLGPGSVVELDNLVEEPVDIKVNGKLVAKRELVMVEDKFDVKDHRYCGEEGEGKKGSLVFSCYVVRYRGSSDRFWLYHRF
jgi:flagellar motor switch protein FliN